MTFKAIATLLEPIAEATNLLSASSYPTMGDLHVVFPVILNILSNALETDNNTVSIQNQIAQRMYSKLHDYWTNMKNSCHASVVLDPNVKLSSFDEETALKVRIFIRNIYSKYMDKQSDSNLLTTTEGCNTSRTYFKKHFKHATGNYRRDILEEYLSSAEEDCDVLEFWRLRSSDVRYSGLAQMARNYLIVQATSVSSEQIFSVAKHTISSTRNRLSTENVRASLCLKTWYEADIIKNYSKNQ